MPTIAAKSWPKTRFRGWLKGDAILLNSRIAVAPKEATMMGIGISSLVFVSVLPLWLYIGGSERYTREMRDREIKAPTKA